MLLDELKLRVAKGTRLEVGGLERPMFVNEIPQFDSMFSLDSVFEVSTGK